MDHSIYMFLRWTLKIASDSLLPMSWVIILFIIFKILLGFLRLNTIGLVMHRVAGKSMKQIYLQLLC